MPSSLKNAGVSVYNSNSLQTDLTD